MALGGGVAGIFSCDSVSVLEVSSSPRSVSMVMACIPQCCSLARSSVDRRRKRCLRKGVSNQDRSIPQIYMPTLTDEIGMCFFAIESGFQKLEEWIPVRSLSQNDVRVVLLSVFSYLFLIES